MRSEEVCRRISESCKGNLWTDEQRQRIIRSKTGRPASPERIERVSHSMQKYWDSPRSDKHRKKMSDLMNKRWNKVRRKK